MTLESWDKQLGYMKAIERTCGSIQGELRHLQYLAVGLRKVGTEGLPHPTTVEETLRMTEALTRSVREMIVTEPSEKQVILMWPREAAE